jgi:hypothetical protein
VKHGLIDCEVIKERVGIGIYDAELTDATAVEAEKRIRLREIEKAFLPLAQLRPNPLGIERRRQTSSTSNT